MAINGDQNVTTEMPVPGKLSRLNYFFGQLLTQRDLKAEQGFHLQLQRLMQREMFGTGTVAGLAVDATAEAAPRGVFVRAGLALDPDGRELLLSKDVCIVVAEEVPTPGDAGLPVPADFVALSTDLGSVWGASIDEIDVQSLADDLFALGVLATLDAPSLRDWLNQVEPPGGFVLAPGITLREHLRAVSLGTTYVGLRYHERGAEPSPATLDGSCCGESNCFPARIEEGVSIVASMEPFAPIADPFVDAQSALAECFLAEENPALELDLPSLPLKHDCRECLCDHLLGAWRGVTATGDPCNTETLPVVPLAVVTWSRFAPVVPGESRVLDVDNCSLRPLAPGVPPTRALLDVITQCTSLAPLAPTIESIEPQHRGELVITSGAASVSVQARANARISLDAAAGWELDFYPTDGSAVARFSDASPPAAFAVSLTVVADSEGDPTVISLVFSGSPLVMAAGTYEWRINLPEAAPTIAAGTTGIKLDGEPRPPAAVPSGNGVPGGVFEAAFFVAEPTP